MIENNENHNQVIHVWLLTPVLFVIHIVRPSPLRFPYLRSLSMRGTDIGARRRNKVGPRKRGEGIIIHTNKLIKVNVTGRTEVLVGWEQTNIRSLLGDGSGGTPVPILM